MHTRTPAPVAPPSAHSRVTRSGHSTGRAIPATASARRLQAGSASSATRGIVSAALRAHEGTGPRTLRLAGRIADGVLFQVGADPRLVSWALAQVEAGAARPVARSTSSRSARAWA